MAHLPFENWLLADERLKPEQERELRLHLRDCPTCDALARANLALRAAPVAAPAQGFALRFQSRLEAQRKIQRRRAIFGSILLALAGFGLLLWLTLPFLPLLAKSPAELFSLWLSMWVYLTSAVSAVTIIMRNVTSVLMGFIPGYVWALSLTFFGGTAFLWAVSFKKFGYFPQAAVQAGGVKR